LKVLLVGSGGREHALAWRLKRSPRLTDLWVAGGNAGTAQVATNLKVNPEDVAAVADAARSLGVDLVVVGPEQPLADGLVDRLGSIGIPAFGPSRAAAQLEASKSFARQVMQDAGIPSPEYRVFRDRSLALDFLHSHGGQLVVKADGLAAGKGVALCSSTEEAVIAVMGCMDDRIFGAAGDIVVIEEWLRGAEVSVFGFSDGENVSNLVAACDYKPIGEGDTGPNTGGMGSFTPPVFWNPQLAEEVSRTIMEPIIGAMAQQGAPYRGMLYAGLMFTQSGPRVLEFNCRFGDPETQVILPLLESDPIEVMTACIEGNLSQTQVCWGAQAHLGVVMVSGGYPGPYATGLEITGLNEEDSDTIVFQAGTQLTADNGGRVVTSGGRVLTVVGRGDSLPQAREAAYRRAEQIHFQNAYYRRDIGDLSTGYRKGV
jgi:phosphoribosylamine--glycine ligase